MDAHGHGLDLLGARFVKERVEGGVRGFDNHDTYEKDDVVYYGERYWRAVRHVDPPFLPALMSGEVPGDSDAWRATAQPAAELLGAARPPVGFGIKDGRGYGPYGTGYYSQDGQDLPYGPRGERLTVAHDFQPGPRGFLGGRKAPIRLAPGVTWCDENGNWGSEKVTPSDVLGMFDLQQVQRDLHGLTVTVEIARILAKSGSDVIAQAIAGAQQPWYKSDLPGETERKNVQDHLQWHVATLGRITGDPRSLYASADDLKKYVVMAFVDANAVEEGAAYLDAAWTAMWNEIQEKLRAMPKAMLKAAGNTVEWFTGVPLWAWIAGGVATAGLVGYAGWKVLNAPVGQAVVRRYLP